jgi:hypothetical protein
MRTKFLSVAVAMAIAANVGCSVYKAGTQPGPADLTGISIGASRQDLIMRISAGHSGSFSALRVHGGRNAATILSLR